MEERWRLMREGVDHTWRQISRRRLVTALNYVCGYFVLTDSDGKNLRVTFLYVRLKIYIFALFIIGCYCAITKTSNTRVSESI